MSSDRPTEEVVNATRRMIVALGRRVANGDPTEIRLLMELGHELDRQVDAAVLGLRERGHSDVDLSQALGVTRQAVSARWPGGGRYVGRAGVYRKVVHDA